ncbi:MAG: hypothetical protein R3Y23_02520 [Bacillota bacterium]
MKKKLLVVAVVAVMVVCIFAFAGCASGNTFNKYNGTYTYSSVWLGSYSMEIDGDKIYSDELADLAALCGYEVDDVECEVRFEDGDVYMVIDEETEFKIGTIDGDELTIASLAFEKE